MITLREKGDRAVLGIVTDDEFLFLAERLEQESPEDKDYFITRDLLETLAGQGMPSRLHDLLNSALAGREEMDIEWSRDPEAGDTDAPLLERASRLSDDELLRMVLAEPDQYRPEALVIAREEIAKRGLPIELPAGPQGSEAGVPPESGLRSSLQQGIEAAASASTYHAAGIEVACPHCKKNLFYSHNVLLNTRGLTFFNLDWLNRGATVLICANCGMLQWFSEIPE